MGSKEGAAKARVKRKNVGRRKGAKGKFTTLKQAFLDAFEATGGTEALTKWGEEEDNREDFYAMITKLLPREIQAEVKHSIMLAPEKITKPEDAGT